MGWISKSTGAATRVLWRAVAAVDSARSLVWDDVWGESGPAREISVSGDGVLRLIPVYAAVSYVAEMIASLPVDFYTKSGGARHAAPDPDWFEQPDLRISRFDWWFQCMASVLLRGNAYGYVLRTGGRISGIRWIHPDRVVVDESGAFPTYRVMGDPKPRTEVSQGGDIVHVRWFVMPGSVKGLNPIELFRLQLETAAGAEQYGHDYFENAILPTGILKNDKQTLDPEQTDAAKRRLVASVRRGEPLALDANWSWESITIKPADAQFLETIKASATQVAVIFRVPPEEVGGETGSSMTYNTVEGNQRKVNTRTLLAWASRLEGAFRAVLKTEKPDDYMKFNLDAMARPDALTVVKILHQELEDGTLVPSEARALRDRAPLTPAQVEEWQAWQAARRGSGGPDVASAVADALSTSAGD